MVNFLGQVNFQGQSKKVGIKDSDRSQHLFVIGKAGVGKSNLLRNMIIQDILNNQGVCFIDFQGDSVEELLNFIPKHRINDVVYFNATDYKQPIAYNFLYGLNNKHHHLVASALIECLKNMWSDVWTTQMEYILFNSFMALFELPNATLLSVNKILNNKSYRDKVIKNVKNPLISNFWHNEYPSYSESYKSQGGVSIQDKFEQLISHSAIYNIIGQVKSRFRLEEIMKKKKILLVNLAEDKIGKEAALFLGSLLIINMHTAIIDRNNIIPEKRTPFYLYIDEFQNFINPAFISVLIKSRKYGLCLILVNQYLVKQLHKETISIIFDNIGTIICFRITAQDAAYLEKEFLPEFNASDLINLEKYYFCLKTILNGIVQKPFVVKNLSPDFFPKYFNKEKIIKSSRERYTVSVDIVKNKLDLWLKA